MSPPSLKSVAIRTVIDEFIVRRRNERLEGLSPDDPRRSELLAQFEVAVWLEDAARRVVQIQAVTHSLKPMHPEARGSSLFRPPKTLASGAWVGTYCLGDRFESDVVGNAAALDVYKFLRLTHEGQTLLDMAVKGDLHFIAALSDDEAVGSQWAAAFAGLTSNQRATSSHTNAKQLYWLLGGNELSAHDDSAFHLLAPLYPTSLVHRVYKQLQDDRFSDEAKAARAARKDGIEHARPVRTYRDLANQKLGGTKPQNISQLNSERRGDNYLLASVPPVWKPPVVRPLLGVDSLYKVWGRRPSVSQHAMAMRRLQEERPPAIAETTQRVRACVEALVDELILFRAELLTLEPGWSRSEDCELPMVQRTWLDPEGQGTGNQRQASDEVVAAEFASWINAQLRKARAMGDTESAEWRRLAHAQLLSTTEGPA